jgi:glycosyltransferase involved in cell wall biosynthesis
MSTTINVRARLRERLLWRDAGWQAVALMVWARRRLRERASMQAPTPLLQAASSPSRLPRILFCDAQLPTPDRDSGSLRAASMLRLLVPMAARVTFVPLDGRITGPYADALIADGIEVARGNAFGLEPFARRRAGGYDIVVLSRPQVATAFLPAVRRHFPDATVVFDTVDLHFLREERMRAVDGGGAHVRPARTRDRELALVDACDITATVTEHEAALVRRLRPRSHVVVLPNVHETRDDEPPPYAQRDGLLFIGSFRHQPNVDAVAFLLDDVLPRVYQRIGAVPCTVIGADPPAELARSAAGRIRFEGYVPDVTPYFDAARALVSPLRYGAGMKGKNGQAMALGLPLVTTSVGAEGMGLVDSETALIADDADALAANIARLHQDAALWSRLSGSAREVAARSWSPDAMRNRLAALLAERVAASAADRLAS